MKFKFKPPIVLTPRFLYGLKIDNGYISIDYSKRRLNQGATNRNQDECRIRYRYYIDLPSGEKHTSDDLQSGFDVKRGLQGGLADLLSFLQAAATDYFSNIRITASPTNGATLYINCQRTTNPKDNSTLFPLSVVEWAMKNKREISKFQREIENSDKKLIEE